MEVRFFAPGSLVWRIVYTASWYAARILWYPFPWSLLAIAAAAVSLGHGRWWPVRNTLKTSGEQEPGWQGGWFAITTSLVLTAAFSMAHRKADRYIFPVYFLMAAAGAGYGLRRSEVMGRMARRFDRAWVPAALYRPVSVLS